MPGHILDLVDVLCSSDSGVLQSEPHREKSPLLSLKLEKLRIIHLQNHTEHRMGWADTQKVDKHTQTDGINLHLDQSV